MYYYIFLLGNNSNKPNILCVMVKYNNKLVSGLYGVYVKQKSKSEFEKLKIFEYTN